VVATRRGNARTAPSADQPQTIRPMAHNGPVSLKQTNTEARTQPNALVSSIPPNKHPHQHTTGHSAHNACRLGRGLAVVAWPVAGDLLSIRRLHSCRSHDPQCRGACLTSHARGEQYVWGRTRSPPCRGGNNAGNDVSTAKNRYLESTVGICR
jgi:hypothetical protein